MCEWAVCTCRPTAGDGVAVGGARDSIPHPRGHACSVCKRPPPFTPASANDSAFECKPPPSRTEAGDWRVVYKGEWQLGKRWGKGVFDSPALGHNYEGMCLSLLSLSLVALN